MKQSNENHPLQLRPQGKIPCRCYSTALWGDARAASGEEGEHTNSSSSMAALHSTRGWCSEGCACLTAALHLAGAPGPGGISPWHAWPGMAAVPVLCFTILTALGASPCFTACRILCSVGPGRRPLFLLTGRTQGIQTRCVKEVIAKRR